MNLLWHERPPEADIWFIDANLEVVRTSFYLSIDCRLPLEIVPEFVHTCASGLSRGTRAKGCFFSTHPSQVAGAGSNVTCYIDIRYVLLFLVGTAADFGRDCVLYYPSTFLRGSGHESTLCSKSRASSRLEILIYYPTGLQILGLPTYLYISKAADLINPQQRRRAHGQKRKGNLPPLISEFQH